MGVLMNMVSVGDMPIVLRAQRKLDRDKQLLTVRLEHELRIAACMQARQCVSIRSDP